MQTIEQALQIILSNTKNFGTETISIHECMNRVLATDIFADRDYPPFNRATMDGYALNSEEFTNGKTNIFNIQDIIHAGNGKQVEIQRGNCVKIMTGAPIPKGANAVIRIEDTILKNNMVQFNIEAVKPKQNIAIQGEDAKKGDLVIKKGKQLNSNSIALLAVTGQNVIQVKKLPSVALVSTGNEIVPVDSPILSHQIRDSNVFSLKSSLEKYKITCLKTSLVEDDKLALQTILHSYLNKDLLIISGGVSKGDADYVPEVLKSLGVNEIFHRVAIKPGNPLWFGKMPNGGVVFGLPGNPISVQVGFKVFIEPYLRKCLEMPLIEPLYLPLFGEKNKKTKFTEYFPCKLTNETMKTGLIPNRMNTSGDISTTNGSDGIAIHPEEIETINKNDIIAFYFWNH